MDSLALLLSRMQFAFTIGLAAWLMVLEALHAATGRPRLSVGMAIILALVLVLALLQNLRMLDRWLERPLLFVFPLIGVDAAIVLAMGVHRRCNVTPGYAAVTILAAAFATFAITFWGEGLFVLPLMLGYTLIGYRVFRGRSGEL
jgi:cytochrome bd ubiquinol oxidase subunit II